MTSLKSSMSWLTKASTGAFILASILLNLLNVRVTSTSIFRLFSFDESTTKYQCAPSAYTIRTASVSPLILHIENFLSDSEANELSKLA